MEYRKTLLKRELRLGGIYSVRYYEYLKNFKYKGESHPFWELVYSDRKGFTISSDGEWLRLETGQLYIHKPDVFHTLHCDDSAANAFIVAFDCECDELYNVAGRIIDCTSEQRRLIGNIIREAGETFSTPLDKTGATKMELANSPFGSAQLLSLFIEWLLISLIRADIVAQNTRGYENNRLFGDICRYLEDNITAKLCFEDIQKKFNLSASVIKRVFRSNTDCGVMEYFNRLKIESAKQLIREGGYNFTEIAEQLAFNNSQYFTTVFRRVTGMTPSEYAASAKSKFGGENK